MELNVILVEDSKFCSGDIMANGIWVASGLHYTTNFLCLQMRREETVSEGQNGSPAAEHTEEAGLLSWNQRAARGLG